jgi:DNA repair exonuclease SbcCD ATPase subunit
MIFNSISLENFGIVRKFAKQFDRQILVVSGENGTGKSTFLKSIMLAVFDEYDGTLADYVNWDSDFFSVAVGFTHRGVQYESEVTYNGATDRTLRFGGTILKGEEAKKKLKEIFDVDLLKAAMLAMEQQIDIVNTKPSERRDYLKRIYDIEFKHQISVIEDEAKEHELELAKRTATQTEIQNRKYTVPKRPEYPFGEIEYELNKSNLELARKTLSDIEGRLIAYQQSRADFDKLTQQTNQLNHVIQKETNEISQLKSKLGELPEKKKSSLETLAREKERQSILNEKELADSAARFSSISDELKIIFPERLPLFDADEFTRVSQELYSKKSKLKELQNVADVCPTCGQSINTSKHIEKRKSEAEDLAKAVSELTNQFINLTATKKGREEAEARNKAKSERKAYLDSRLALEAEKQNSIQSRGKAALEKIESEIARFDSDIVSQEKYLQEILATKETSKDGLLDQLKDVQTRLDEAQKKINQLPELPLEETKRKIADLEKAVKSYDDVISRIQEIEKIERQIETQKKQDAEQLEILKDEIQVLNKFLGDTKASIKILKSEFPIYVISRLIKDIEKSMNGFLKKTYGGRYEVEVSDKKNALRILYGPKKKDVSLASGYEKQVFSSAFRLALCQALGSKSLLLDEVDSAASDKNSEVLYNVLGKLVGSGIEQMIVITHKSSTRNLLESDYNAEVITFENGVAA